MKFFQILDFFPLRFFTSDFAVKMKLAAVFIALLRIALASPNPAVSISADITLPEVSSNGTSPAAFLEAAFRQIHESKNADTVSARAEVITTRNELVDGGCNDVIVIFARGTTEPGNVGDDVGPSFFDSLEALEPGRILVQGVNDYPADIWGYLVGGSESGAVNMAGLVAQAASQCPSAKIVLSGFSQGAQVAHKAAAKISSSLYSKVAAIVLFGDPDNGDPFPGTLNANVITFCADGDLICDGWPIPTDAHSHYEDDGPAAAAYVAARV
ncbi:hypothetical protein RUND412_003051 [Rhizina undulata]